MSRALRLTPEEYDAIKARDVARQLRAEAAARSPANAPGVTRAPSTPAAEVCDKSERVVPRSSSAPFKLTAPRPLESDVQPDVLRALLNHPKVAWAARMNAGAGRFVYPNGETSRFIRFGFPGMSDIFLQLIDGRFGACEVKRPGEDPDDDQQAFLDRVNRHGGLGFVARSAADVYRELAAA